MGQGHKPAPVGLESQSLDSDVGAFTIRPVLLSFLFVSVKLNVLVECCSCFKSQSTGYVIWRQEFGVSSKRVRGAKNYLPVK